MKPSDYQDIEKKIADSYELPNRVLGSVPAPVVSVRTSTYQHAPYIRECIEGVLMQRTDFPFEYIIGEDCSTDGTREIVFDYARKYPEKIRVLTADYNVGMKANGRRCFQAARGAYLATCEGDDYWTDPRKLQRQVEALEARPSFSLCFHNARVVHQHRRRSAYRFATYEKEVYTIEDIIRRHWFIPTQSMLYRRTLLQRPEWTRYIYNGDLALQLLLASQGPFFCINEVMSVYRQHRSSVSARKPTYYSPQRVIQLLHYFDMHTDFKFHASIERRIIELHQGQYRAYLYERPWWIRVLSPDFYLYKKRGLARRLRAWSAARCEGSADPIPRGAARSVSPAHEGCLEKEVQ